MSMLKMTVGALAVIVLAGCQNDAQMLASQKTQAVQTAVARGKFELDCPTATGEVLSQETVQPPVRGPLMIGAERVQYTIGVAGCEKRQSYVVLCEIGGSGCFAADGQ